MKLFTIKQNNNNNNKNEDATTITSNNNKMTQKKGFKGVKNRKTYKGKRTRCGEMEQSPGDVDRDMEMGGGAGQDIQLDRPVGQDMVTEVDTDSD